MSIELAAFLVFGGLVLLARIVAAAREADERRARWEKYDGGDWNE